MGQLANRLIRDRVKLLETLIEEAFFDTSGCEIKDDSVDLSELEAYQSITASYYCYKHRCFLKINDDWCIGRNSSSVSLIQNYRHPENLYVYCRNGMLEFEKK